MKMKNLLISTVTILALSGCGGGDTKSPITPPSDLPDNSNDTESPATPPNDSLLVLADNLPDNSTNTNQSSSTNTQTGKFIDSPVSNLSYICSSTGNKVLKTTSDGKFTCQKGQRIKFMVGRTSLGKDGGWMSFNHVVTPKTLFANSIEAVRLAQVLQTLDTDGDPENGIDIDVEFAKYLEKIDFADDDFKTIFKAQVDRLKNPNSSVVRVNQNMAVVDYDTAKLHLDKHTAKADIDAIREDMQKVYAVPTEFVTSAGTYSMPVISRAEQLKFVDAVNKTRGQNQTCGKWGAMPATSLINWNTKLHDAAYSHNWDMAYGGVRKHVGSGTDTDVTATNLNLGQGSTAGERISYFGYEYARVAENIARGYPTVEQAIEGWLSSEDHCKSLMSPEYAEMGLSHMIWTDDDGSKHHYWTQDFGAIRTYENPNQSYPAKIEPKQGDDYHITVYGSLRCPKTKAFTQELNSKNIPYLFRDVYNYSEDRVDPKRVLMVGVTPAFYEVMEIKLTIDDGDDGKIMMPVAVVKRGENTISTDAANMTFLLEEIK